MNLSFSGALQADNTTMAANQDVVPPGSSAQTSAVTTEKGPFDWLDSRLPIHFTLDFNSYYDDNIFIAPVKTNDYVFRISPGLDYSLGVEGETDNYLYLKYVPTIIEYYTNSQQDAVNQYANMLYEHNFAKLKLTLEQTYNHSNDTSIQAGAIVVSNIYDTHINAHYDYSDKLSINADVNQSLAYYPSTLYSNVYEWSGGAYFLYQITPKISMGVGGRGGYDEIPRQPSQTWEQGLLHLTYNVTEKVTLTASGGGEIRQFDTGISDQVTGVFNLGAYWTPFHGTSLSLTGYRRNAPSYSVGGTNFTATGISAGIRQNFLQDFYLGLNGGYENDAYTPASQGVTGARNDNYYYMRPYFQWTPQKWVSLTAYYQYSRNDSTLYPVSFNDNQIGTSIIFRY